ncbi:MAG TPA: hypothetical protein VET87_09520 [Rubrivivax sp.]|nr:hypothetical protein [Rubrivivax sp.]
MSLNLEKIKEEALAMLPPTIFFFVALHVIALVRALMTRGTGLPVTSSAQIALAALIVGKAVLLADLWPPINRFPQRPLIYNIAWKTAIYYLMASLIHYLERLFDFAREAGGVVAGNRRLLAEIIWPHVLAIQIILLVIIFAYCVIRELGHALGEDKVFSMFFREPRAIGAFRRNGPPP